MVDADIWQRSVSQLPRANACATCDTMHAPTSEDDVPTRLVFLLLSLGSCGRRGFFSNVLPFWTFVDDVGSSLVLDPRAYGFACRWLRDEEEPPTMITGHNSLVFFVLILTWRLCMLRSLESSTTCPIVSLLYFSCQPCSELCQDAALWRQERERGQVRLTCSLLHPCHLPRQHWVRACRPDHDAFHTEPSTPTVFANHFVVVPVSTISPVAVLNCMCLWQLSSVP